jgi:tetratricopeptide (TPR) repeat protein
MSERWRGWAAPAVALLAIASSAIGVLNSFTYDDRYIVELNPATRNLHRWWTAFGQSYWPKDWGGDGYRPLTIIAYKLEAVLGGRSPVAFHAVNILLYAVVAVLVLAIARRLLPFWAAWATAALFAVHPVHVEAVAGIVGQSELLVAIALLSALLLYLRDRADGPLRTWTAVGIAALYVVACFSKEHGVVLPALLGAAELTVIADSASLRERVRRLRPFYLVLVLIAVAFVAVRSRVLADHGIGGFQPFTPFSTLHISNPDRMLTALGVVPEWIRLFYWPVHLSSEYGPPDIEIAQGFALSQLPGFLLLVAILSFGVALRRRQRAISFGIAIAVITLLPASNFIVPAGIVLAERTLFLPSVGAMIVLGAIVVLAADYLRGRVASAARLKVVAATVCGVLLLTGAIRSAERTTVWRDNDTLFRHAVVDSPLSYRAHYMLGAWDFENKRKREGEAEYRRALSLFPYDPFLSYNMAEQYRTVGLCAPALPLYKWTHDLDPNFPLGHGAYAWCLLNEGQYQEAKVQAFKAIRAGGIISGMRRVIFIADSASAADARKRQEASVSLAGRSSKVQDSVQKAARPAAKPRAP